MKEKINNSLYIISLFAALGFLAWYLLADVSLSEILMVFVLTIALLEVISLVLVSKNFPESHTQFKIGMIVGLFVLLGIRQMAPSFFAPLTLTVLIINYMYNFYANAKRKKGAFKRRKNQKLRF